MNVIINPAAKCVFVDGQGQAVDALPAGHDERIHLIEWNGRDGVIHRTSAVPGRFDIEHFADEGRLAPYVDAWKAADAAAKAAAEKAAVVHSNS